MKFEDKKFNISFWIILFGFLGFLFELIAPSFILRSCIEEYRPRITMLLMNLLIICIGYSSLMCKETNSITNAK